MTKQMNADQAKFYVLIRTLILSYTLIMVSACYIRFWYMPVHPGEHILGMLVFCVVVSGITAYLAVSIFLGCAYVFVKGKQFVLLPSGGVGKIFHEDTWISNSMFEMIAFSKAHLESFEKEVVQVECPTLPFIAVVELEETPCAAMCLKAHISTLHDQGIDIVGLQAVVECMMVDLETDHGKEMQTRFTDPKNEDQQKAYRYFLSNYVKKTCGSVEFMYVTEESLFYPHEIKDAPEIPSIN
jgi:hypothetical protein